MKEPACMAIGSPDWWTSYSEFMCELPDGHEGKHRMVIEWQDPPSLDAITDPLFTNRYGTW